MQLIPEPNLLEIYQTLSAALDAAEPKLFNAFKANFPQVFKVKKMLYAIQDNASNQFTQSQPAACRLGCSSCCSQLIPVTPFEVFIIAIHLQKTLNPNELQAIKQRLKINAEIHQSSRTQKFGPARIPCAFLSASGQCQIHPIRPLRCRGYFSSDKNACDNQVRNPSIQIPVNAKALAFSRGLQSGLAEVLLHFHLDEAYYELQAAVLNVLNDKRALKKWLKGKKIFSQCLKSESHPKVIWVAPQSNQQTIVLTRNKNHAHGKKIDIQTFDDND